MRLHRHLAAFALLCVFLPLTLHAQQLPAAITADPVHDKTNPAGFETFQIPSHGALLNALAYIAPGPAPHPVVLLLHGFPGNEKNLDLAQAIRRDGWDVVYFDYRGSWGSPATSPSPTPSKTHNPPSPSCAIPQTQRSFAPTRPPSSSSDTAWAAS
ncbi:alpha/beta hydrolase family protein [Tunturiibacter gelidiferens]|uniref:alpha/beta hydrolase family protein n=1 Tax=Tunturiibacter gelidiferens TaxID=3069689 RepID=UPI003D9BF263